MGPTRVTPSRSSNASRSPPPNRPRPSAPRTELSASPEVSAAAAAAALAQSIRLFGHRGAHVDPLGSEPPGDPHLDYAAHGLTRKTWLACPRRVVGGAVGHASLPNAARGHPPPRADLLRRDRLRVRPRRRSRPSAPGCWKPIEEERFRPPNDPVDERELLDRLTEVSAFERFLHRAYPGQTRFSVEGLGMLIPMLDELIADAAAQGTRTIMLGMAHRGRLNVLAHVLGKPYAPHPGRVRRPRHGRPLRARPPRASTKAGPATSSTTPARAASSAQSASTAPSGAASPWSWRPIRATWSSSIRSCRAWPAPPTRIAAPADHARTKRLAGVLIHGDASFPGQGIVAETLNLSRLTGYATGGTLHIIANNQLGFTTEPRDGRSTLYASDLAKGFEMPIVHVNADDPIACLAAIRLAAAYRAEFAKDFLIDLIGYRRWGHNEGDDPSFTQPRMYAAIDKQPTVRELFAADLVASRRGPPG